MSRSEEHAYEFIRAVQNPDNSVAKDLLRGRSVAYRKMILRQLKKWDCDQDLNTRLLKVRPKERLLDS